MAKNTSNDKKNSPSNQDLELAFQGINKKFGEGALMRLGDATKMSVSVISTGSLAIDLALGEAVFPGEESLKYTDPNHLVKQPFA